MTMQPEIMNITNHSDVINYNLSTIGMDEQPIINSWFKSVIFFSLMTTCVLGTIANLLVVYIIIRRRKMKRVIHFLTLNLAISDLMVLLIYLPLQLNSINKQLKWDLGQISCRFFYMVNAFTVNASICTLIAITRDRYLAISYPMKIHSRGVESIKCWIPIIWLVSFLMTAPLLFVVDVSSGYCTEAWPNLTFERIYWISIFIIQILLPIILFTISYSIIIYRFGKSSAVFANKPIQHRCRLKRRKQKRRLLQMSVLLTVVYLLCSLPQHLVFFAVSFNVLQYVPGAVYIFVISNFLMVLNSAINPVIYGSQSDEVKREFSKIIPCLPTIKRLTTRKYNARTSISTNTLHMMQNLSSFEKNKKQNELKKRKCYEKRLCIRKPLLIKETVIV